MASAKRDSNTHTIAVSSVILDIEGTTSSISFVKDVLFPYVRSHLELFLNENWGSADFQEHIKALKTQAQQDEENKVEGVITIPEEGDADVLKTAVINNIKWQMDNDRKTKSLKDIQGLIMEKGYKVGDLKGHVYDDVEQSLKSWAEQGKSIYIYSSGSVHAQKLLFGHSEKGDLLPLIKGHFDTTVGMKGDVNSYKEILKQIASSPSETAFFTDIPTEAKAAKEAGILAILLSREGNAPLSDEDKTEFQVITSFEYIEFEENSCKKRKICSDITVNVENKEIKTCSLSIEGNNKPDSPQIASNSADELMEVDESPAEKTNDNEYETSDARNKADELMQVEESSAEKTSISEIKTSGACNTNQNDDSVENKKEVTVNSNSESKLETSNNKAAHTTCKIEGKKVENVKSPVKKEKAVNSDSESKIETSNNEVADTTCKIMDKEAEKVETSIGNKKEEMVVSSESKIETSNEAADSTCKNEDENIENSGKKEEEMVNSSESKVETSNDEAADSTCKNEDENIENSIGNKKKEMVKSDSESKIETSNEETADSTCKNEDENIKNSENSNKKEEIVNSDSESKLKTSLNEEAADTTCKMEDEKVKIVEIVSRDVTEGPGICQQLNNSNQEKNLTENEHKKTPKPDTEDKLKPSINNKEKQVETSSDLIAENIDDKNAGATKMDTKDHSETKLCEDQKEEEVPKKIVVADKSQNGLETKEKSAIEICNGVVNEKVEVKAVSEQEAVETVDEIKSDIKSENNTAQITVDHKESSSNKKQSNPEECKTDIKPEECEDALLKSPDVIDNSENSQNTIKTEERNGSTHIELTNDKTEVPLIKKTEENVSSGNGPHLNGTSSLDLNRDNGFAQEVPLEGKKCDTSENTSVETVVEA